MCYWFTELLASDWEFVKGPYDKVIITLISMVNAGEIKIHANYDDRYITTGEKANAATFSGVLEKMVKIFDMYDRTKITYGYDEVGNRESETYTNLADDYSLTYSYSYYQGSNRLKEKASASVDGYDGVIGGYRDGLFKIGPSDHMAYQYDTAGNMIAKGSEYSLNGDALTYESGNHWEYEYNSKNRLVGVRKDDAEIAGYTYDHNGQRVKVEEGERTTYFVYNYLGQMIYEVTGDDVVAYIYGNGRLLAKVIEVEEASEGTTVDVEEVYFYHQDNLGSTMLMTDDEGNVVFKQQDYAPFGQNLYHPGVTEAPSQDVEAGFKYTSQYEDVDTGLYYYNARYYDPEIGRFTRDDDYQGDIRRPQTLNLFFYVTNNPLRYTDPSGHRLVEEDPNEPPSEVTEVANSLIYTDEYDVSDILTAMDVEGRRQKSLYSVSDLYRNSEEYLQNIDVHIQADRDSLTKMKTKAANAVKWVADAFGEGFYCIGSNGQMIYLPKEYIEEHGPVSPEYVLAKEIYNTDFSDKTIGPEFAVAGNFGFGYIDAGVGLHFELNPLQDLKSTNGRQKLLNKSYWRNYVLNQIGFSSHVSSGYDLYIPNISNLSKNLDRNIPKEFRVGFSWTIGPTYTWNTPKVKSADGLAHIKGINFMGWGVNYSTAEWAPNTPSAIQIFGGKGIMIDYHQGAAWYFLITPQDFINFINKEGK